ncbi:MAG: ROK family protein [Candidatus Latescibacterota bacterium]
MSGLYVGVDLGGTNVRSGLVDGEGNILCRDKRKTLARESAETPVRQIVDSITEVVCQGKMNLSDLTAIGIGSPGPLSGKKGMILRAGNLPHWINFPLAEIIRERTGVRTWIQNDANVFALGEWWKGSGRGLDNFFILTLGTGIGGGAICEGKLLTGFNDNASEFGHMTIDYNGVQCWCGQRGCLEMYSSATGLVRMTLEAVANEHIKTPLSAYLCKPEELNSYIIYTYAKEGDDFAVSMFDKAGYILGIGIVNALNLLNFERVAIGGGLSRAGDLIFEPARRALEERGFQSFNRDVSIVPAELQEDAAILGAVRMVIEKAEE